MISQGGSALFQLPSTLCLSSTPSLLLETDGTDGNGDGAGSVSTQGGTFSGTGVTPLTANSGPYTFAPTSAGSIYDYLYGR
ncbi:MAG: hypothetical protein IPL33_00395 [Sphingobacteriales bacterium]|nr:hypothetical protein [Sphingobacteriales bacterium]